MSNWFTVQRVVISFLILLVGMSLFAAWFYARNPLGPKAEINGTILTLELAVTPEEKQQGLSGRTELLPNHGMLFLYDHKDQFSFWMKDMKIPLDFVWIDGTKVVDLTANVPPPIGNTLQLPVYTPKVAVDKILELPAGSIEQIGIKEGDTIKFLD